MASCNINTLHAASQTVLKLLCWVVAFNNSRFILNLKVCCYLFNSKSLHFTQPLSAIWKHKWHFFKIRQLGFVIIASSLSWTQQLVKMPAVITKSPIYLHSSLAISVWSTEDQWVIQSKWYTFFARCNSQNVMIAISMIWFKKNN